MNNITKKFVVRDPKGLHARPSGKIVTEILGHKSVVEIRYQDKTAEGDSVLDILMLAIPCGAEIEINVVGEDADKVMEKLAELF